MKQEETKFIIDQLRKDKIIYATEATATVLVCILSFIFAQFYFEDPKKYIISVFVLLIGVGYTLFMGIGNFIRLRKIKKLERELFS
ncbi:MAG: hypothetical protein AAB788_04085 [Patescibacteria group bacterium]